MSLISDSRQKKKFVTTLNVLNNVYFLHLMLNVTNDPVQQATTHLNKSFTRKRMILVKIPNVLSTPCKNALVETIYV